METNTGTTELNDPLAASCDDIDISYPLLPASNYEMQVKDAKVEPNKKGTGNNLIMQWVNAKEQQSTKGDVVNVGQVAIRQYTGLTETEKYSNKDIAKNITRIAKALRIGGVSPRDIIDNPSQLIGKTALVKIAIKKETEEFPEGNEIKSFIIEG